MSYKILNMGTGDKTYLLVIRDRTAGSSPNHNSASSSNYSMKKYKISRENLPVSSFQFLYRMIQQGISSGSSSDFLDS